MRALLALRVNALRLFFPKACFATFVFAAPQDKNFTHCQSGGDIFAKRKSAAPKEKSGNRRKK